MSGSLCLTELRAESSGALWVGEGREGVAIVKSGGDNEGKGFTAVER